MYVCTSCVCVYEQHVCMGVYVYPSVFNLEGAAAGVYVGSIESSFGLLGILNRFKRCDTIKEEQVVDSQWNSNTVNKVGQACNHNDKVNMKGEIGQRRAPQRHTTITCSQ